MFSLGVCSRIYSPVSHLLLPAKNHAAQQWVCRVGAANVLLIHCFRCDQICMENEICLGGPGEFWRKHLASLTTSAVYIPLENCSVKWTSLRFGSIPKKASCAFFIQQEANAWQYPIRSIREQSQSDLIPPKRKRCWSTFFIASFANPLLLAMLQFSENSAQGSLESMDPMPEVEGSPETLAECLSTECPVPVEAGLPARVPWQVE